MSLYLGTTKISGVATGDAAVSVIGNNTGSDVIVGEITLSASDTSITISDIIGKDNVTLMYMDSCSCPDSRMADAGLVNVIIQGEKHSYNVHYYSELIVCVDDGFIQYDKTIGKIDTNSNMRYNECFIAGKYIYVAW